MAAEVIQSLEVKELIQRGRTLIVSAADSIVGTTAGWVKNNNKGLATLPQSQTGSTLILPLNIPLNATISGFKIHGQIACSGANTATLDADLRETTPAVGGCSDASLGAITQVSKTANHLLDESKTLATPTKTTAGNSYYILVTGTTAATTDEEVNSIEIIYDTL